MALIALRKLNLQTRMRSNPLGLHVWALVRPFVYYHTLCVRTAKALARLRGCAVLPEPSLFAFAISTIISWAGSYNNWAASWQNQQNDLCLQRRLRLAWASAQSHQSLRWPHEETFGPQLPLLQHQRQECTIGKNSCFWLLTCIKGKGKKNDTIGNNFSHLHHK